MPKYLTVDEANRTLPLVRRIVADILSSHRKLQKLADAYRSIEGETAEEQARRDQMSDELQELTNAVNRYVDELQEIGVLFKGFDEGLVDFYSMLDGRAIFLCWKYGEGEVEWWHEIEAGYTGRRRLPLHLLSGSA